MFTNRSYHLKSLWFRHLYDPYGATEAVSRASEAIENFPECSQIGAITWKAHLYDPYGATEAVSRASEAIENFPECSQIGAITWKACGSGICMIRMELQKPCRVHRKRLKTLQNDCSQIGAITWKGHKLSSSRDTEATTRLGDTKMVIQSKTDTFSLQVQMFSKRDTKFP